MKEQSFNIAISAVATYITHFIGGWDSPMKFLVFFLILDFILGFLSAIREKRLNSDVMFWGGIRKAAVLIVIAIAVQLDEFMGNTEPIFRTLAIYYYVAREGLSILENLGKLQVPLPPFIIGVLEQLHEKGNSTFKNKKGDE